MIHRAASRVHRLVTALPDDPKDYFTDDALREHLAFLVVTAVQGCLSVAAEVARADDRALRAGLGGLFRALVEQGHIPTDLGPPLQAAVQLRNRILFDYEGLPPGMLVQGAYRLPDVLVSFLEHVGGAAGHPGVRAPGACDEPGDGGQSSDATRCDG